MDNICRQGANSVSIVGRLSTVRSVHYALWEVPLYNVGGVQNTVCSTE